MAITDYANTVHPGPFRDQEPKTGGGETPAPVQLSQTVGMLTEGVGRLEKIVSALTEKLVPITAPHPSVEKDNAARRENRDAPLVSYLMVLAQHLSTQNARLEDLLRSLSL